MSTSSPPRVGRFARANAFKPCARRATSWVSPAFALFLVATGGSAAALEPPIPTVQERLGHPSSARLLILDRNAPRLGVREDALLDRVVSIGPGVPREGWLAAYRELLAPLPPGVYQLIVHLGHDDEEMRGATWDHPDWGAAWRQNDLELVKSDAFRQFLREQGFVLISWRDLARARP